MARIIRVSGQAGPLFYSSPEYSAEEATGNYLEDTGYPATATHIFNFDTANLESMRAFVEQGE